MTQQSYYWAHTWEKPNSKRHIHPNVHGSTMYNNQDTEAS